MSVQSSATKDDEHVPSPVEKVEIEKPDRPLRSDGSNLTPRSPAGHHGFSKDMHHTQWDKRIERMFRVSAKARSRRQVKAIAAEKSVKP